MDVLSPKACQNRAQAKNKQEASSHGMAANISKTSQDIQNVLGLEIIWYDYSFYFRLRDTPHIFTAQLSSFFYNSPLKLKQNFKTKSINSSYMQHSIQILKEGMNSRKIILYRDILSSQH